MTKRASVELAPGLTGPRFLALRCFWCNKMASSSSARRSASSTVQDALTQQIEVGTPVHRSLYQFEPVYLTFRLPVAVWRGERGFHRFSLPPDLAREALQVR